MNPNVNDMLEIMPGSKPRADPRERLLFTKACIQDYDEKEKHLRRKSEKEASQRVYNEASELETYQAMFPDLEPNIIWEVVKNWQTNPDQIIKELSFLAGTNEQPPPRLEEVNQEDFPSLVDAEGWELGGAALLHSSDNENTAWGGATPPLPTD